MERNWHLANIDQRRKATGVNGRLPELMSAGNDRDWIVKLLAPPIFPSSRSVPAYYLTPTIERKHELGALSVLPPEIIAHIFSHLKSADDAICLAVTHRLLGHDGFRRVWRLRRRGFSHLGSWAGDRIITIEDGASDVPNNILTVEELKEVRKVSKGRRGLYHYVGKHYGWANAQRECTCIACVENPALARVLLGTGDHLRVRLLLSDTTPQYDMRGNWALCNLDTKEYARAKAIAKARFLYHADYQRGSSVNGPFVSGPETVLYLGSLALILTTWSKRGGIRGPWAGNRLVICDVDTLKSQKWEDMSDWGVIWGREYVVEHRDMYPKFSMY
ncbi:unnamed protein product [Peniophora sp. CBMAI 1063]|nr:unnamed protein product [Peniophora sp. CBMAI 1063]